ncbi:MAG: UpxY family transcription antiterminator [Bacteroidales bacterium]|nr:UpxY family transcription antiterminator [Bacteroidales bacterium]
MAREFEKQHIHYYLPLYKTIRQWSDRKKKVELPLIRSYIFVRITLKEYLKVLETTGVVKIVCFSGKPVPIPEWQIDNLKLLLGAGVPFTTGMCKYRPGEEVVVDKGQLSGLRGTIVKVKGKHKLVISISALSYNVTVEINPAFVEGV